MKSRGLIAIGVVALVGILACGEDKIEVRPAGDATDYNHGAMLSAVDKFVAAGRTPAAYGELAQSAFELRTGMDRSVARETELKLMVLALAPVQSVHAKSMRVMVRAATLRFVGADGAVAAATPWRMVK